MQKWYMVTVVGHDQPGMVARVAQALDRCGCYLGEASMTRLGDRFTVMLAVRCAAGRDRLAACIHPVSAELSLFVHIDELDDFEHSHVVPDVRITVSGADRSGIVATVTTALADAGLNIIDLQSEVAGSPEAPIYIMYIEGQALRGIEALRKAVAALSPDIDIRLNEIEPMLA